MLFDPQMFPDPARQVRVDRSVVSDDKILGLLVIEDLADSENDTNQESGGHDKQQESFNEEAHAAYSTTNEEPLHGVPSFVFRSSKSFASSSESLRIQP